MKKNFIENIGNLTDAQHVSYYKFLIDGISSELEDIKLNNLYSIFSKDKKKSYKCKIYFFIKKIKFKFPTKVQLYLDNKEKTYSLKAYLPFFCCIQDTPNDILSKSKLKKEFESSLLICKKFEFLATKKIYYSGNLFICEIPLLTQDGTFFITGCERIVISQIIRAPGIYFQKNFNGQFNNKVLTTIISDKGFWTKFDDFVLHNENNISAAVKGNLVSLFHFLKYFGISKKELLSTFQEEQAKAFEALLKKQKIFYEKSFSPLKDFTVQSFYDSREGCFSIGLEGRLKINAKFNYKVPEYLKYITATDLINTLKNIINIKYFGGEVDDIDHLKNKKIRPVGSVLQAQFRANQSLVLKSLEEEKNFKSETRFSKQLDFSFFKSKASKKNDLQYAGALKISNGFITFFKQSALSQYMDQTNCLSEITHKRRVTVFGPNGIKREATSADIRNIHPSQYGKLCPIETPEGEAAGLVSSFSIFSKFNPLGYLESPAYQIKNGSFIKNQTPIYVSPSLESKIVLGFPDISIARANNKIIQDVIRSKEDTFLSNLKREEVKFVGKSPLQLLSFAIGLVPFVEHNDANRGLMGANMQRQAVPLLYLQKPIVGTGFESVPPLNSQACVISYTKGDVKKVTSNRIDIYDINGQKISYFLKKYYSSNQGTCKNQQACIWEGEKVFSGQIIADSNGSLDGEFSIGKNLIVAYMPWDGYNFEDAIVINEKLVNHDILTSIHIEEYEDSIFSSFFDTKDLNYKEKISSLDSFIKKRGYLYCYCILILIKLQLNYKYNYSYNKKLNVIYSCIKKSLKSINSTDHLDNAKNFNKIFLDISHKISLLLGIKKEKNKIKKQNLNFYNDLNEPMLGYFHLTSYESRNLDEFGIIKKGSSVFCDDILAAKFSKPNEGWATNEQLFLDALLIDKEIRQYKDESFRLPKGGDGKVIDVYKFKDKASESQKLEKIKFIIGQIRKIQTGDKLAGRHGNKGVISKIVPAQDMPCLPNGVPIDIILNPLGVPSRMNIGQIFEGLLGLSGYYLGKRFSVTPFDEVFGHEASRILVNQKLKEASFTKKKSWIYSKQNPGKILLRDGRSGDFFDNPIFVGKSYIIKLIHLVEDKIHARSVGSYSMISEQPLAGKALKGGQRFGEMEVWALEAFGCSSVLNEMLTIKSDDISARAHTYESIVFDKNLKNSEPSIGESFLVLIRELNSMGIDLSLKKVGVELENFSQKVFSVKNTKNIFDNIESALKIKALLDFEKKNIIDKGAHENEADLYNQKIISSKLFTEIYLKNFFII